jgi:hypothetical protein
MEMIQGRYHTSQLRKAFEAANGGVTRVDPAIRCEIVEDAMAVIRAERNFLTLWALAVLSEKNVQNRYHVDVTFKMIRLIKAQPVSLPSRGPKMSEMDARGEAAGDRRQIVINSYPEATGAEAHPVRRRWDS